MSAENVLAYRHGIADASPPEAARVIKELARALAESEERVRVLETILQLHNQTPTGKTRRCLPGCIVCAALAETPR